jgi:hypothetical protein
MAVALVEIERVQRQKMSQTAFEFASASVTVLSCLKNPKYRVSNNQKPKRETETIRLTSASGA